MLNLSKSGGNTDQGSNFDEHSERSDLHSPSHTIRDDSLERHNRRNAMVGLGGVGGNGGSGIIGVDDDDDDNLSDENASEGDERLVKDDEGGYFETPPHAPTNFNVLSSIVLSPQI